MKFIDAQDAFEFYYDYIIKKGIDYSLTKAIFNVGFYIMQPKYRDIHTSFRNWNKKYAEREWNWYMSGDRSVKDIKKYAPIWDKMHSGDNLVNSNYGYYWKNQWKDVINKLKEKDSRQAVFSMYNADNINEYDYDTPCTLTIHFQIIESKLCMTVNMRSNDLWYGFCNDQYCFSKLQEKISDELKIQIGWYYHFTSNLHLYYENI